MKSDKSGFTLVELLVAITLSAMLLTAVIGVVARVGRNTDRVIQPEPELWKLAATERLEQEMMNGISYSLRDNDLTIRGYSGRNYPSQEATLTENVVRYCLGECRGMLLREDQNRSQAVRNYVCDGVAAIQLVDRTGREFLTRTGGFDHDVTFRFLDSSGELVFQAAHLR